MMHEHTRATATRSTAGVLPTTHYEPHYKTHYKENYYSRHDLSSDRNTMNAHKIKQEICEIGRRIYAKGFAAANDGNLSYRIGENEVLCTPTMVCKGSSVAFHPSLRPSTSATRSRTAFNSSCARSGATPGWSLT